MDSWVKRRLARLADVHFEREMAEVKRIGKPEAHPPVRISPYAESAATAPAHIQRGKSTVPGTRLYPLILLCEAHGLPVPRAEFPFAEPLRRWRADYCWVEHKLILEVNGGLFVQGRHTRGAGALADMEKLSEAAILGYRVIYATPSEVDSGAVLDRVRRALACKSV